MFGNLSDRLTHIFDKLKRRGVLSETDVNEALREVRVALLEADVALPVAKDFVAKVKEKAIGQEVLRSISPGQMVVKIVHDQLVETLGSTTPELNLSTKPPAVILMVGLQGSGKTTSTAKLARHLTTKLRKKVLMASLDTYRPAAQDQLKILGEQIHVATLPIVQGQMPVPIAKRALESASLQGYDVLLLDTAGRLHLDDALMEEVDQIQSLTHPIETLLVADAMTGQDAVNIAKAFHERLKLTGIVLTRVDGDARGGAALSMRFITGCPIKFVGIGEKIDQLDTFHPDRMAGRILGMGDVVSLVEKAAENINQEDAEKLVRKMEKGQFDLNDLAEQLKQMQKMGGMGSVMNMLPGVQKIKDKIADAGMDDKILKRQVAIIQSMTPKERKYPKLLNASRKKRVASGAGVLVQDINKLLKQFEGMSKMMKQMKKMGNKGFLRNGLKNFLPRF
jgi:signal recognition particle subunit SRP54